MRHFLWRTPSGRVLVAGLVLWALWTAWQTWQAPGKIDDDVRAAATQARRGVDVLVRLPFEPERFHVLVMQKYGRVSGTRERTIEVRGVSPAGLNSIARLYWVRSIELLAEHAP